MKQFITFILASTLALTGNSDKAYGNENEASLLLASSVLNQVQEKAVEASTSAWETHQYIFFCETVQIDHPGIPCFSTSGPFIILRSEREHYSLAVCPIEHKVKSVSSMEYLETLLANDKNHLPKGWTIVESSLHDNGDFVMMDMLVYLSVQKVYIRTMTVLSENNYYELNAGYKNEPSETLTRFFQSFSLVK
ncbi:MAG: hypothetical protein Q8K75_00150 [Chlamydiales bacterium]|nr:hypothetical protein [Chlamydiales bacterium]